MHLSSQLEVLINTRALPFSAVSSEVTPRGQAMMMGTMKKCLEDSRPSCSVSSIREVNRRLSEQGLGPNPLDGKLAIETFELEKAARERSRDSSQKRGSAQKQEVDAKSVRTFTKRKIADKNLLAELFQHPEFNPSQPNELPNEVVFLDMIRNLILAERSPVTGKTFCVEKELEKFFLSPSVKAIWLDSFWWIFHERYKPDRETQNKLFDRIAVNYASLLFHGPGSFYERAILKSWLNTHEFKSSICDTLSLWFSGVYPTPQSYNSWNYSKLDPERHRREALMSPGKDSGSLFTPRRATSPRLSKPTMQYAANEKTILSGTKSEKSCRAQNAPAPKEPLRQTLVLRKATKQVKKISEARCQAETLSKQSHPAGRSPEMEKYLFNMCAKSPLILHFLQKYSSLAQHGEDVLITRRERGRMLPEASLTYHDIIRLALSSMVRRRNRIVQMYQLHQQRWQRFDKELRELWDEFQRELKKVERKEAEMKKQSHKFIIPQSSAKPFSRQYRESHLKEYDFILRRNQSTNMQKGKT